MTSINSDFMSQLALRSLGNSSNMMTQAIQAILVHEPFDEAAFLRAEPCMIQARYSSAPRNRLIKTPIRRVYDPKYLDERALSDDEDGLRPLPLFQADMERRENHEAVGVQLVQQFFPEYTKGSGW